MFFHVLSILKISLIHLDIIYEIKKIATFVGSFAKIEPMDFLSILLIVISAILFVITIYFVGNWIASMIEGFVYMFWMGFFALCATAMVWFSTLP